MNEDMKNKLIKSLNVFLNSDRFKEAKEQTQEFLEWRESLEMLNETELKYLTDLYYQDINDLTEYSILIKDSEDDIYNYRYVIKCKDISIVEKEFNKTREELTNEDEDYNNEAILSELIQKNVIFSFSSLEYDLTLIN